MPDKLPVSAPPFPMREAYQLYFGTPMGGIPSAPIPVTLPNVGEFEPGDQAEIWYFDGSPMGGTGQWKLAGLGTVSDDGRTVASNAGVGIPRFCGVCGLMSLACPQPPVPPQPPPRKCPSCGKPIDLFTGQELMSMDVMTLGGLTPIDMSMKYNPVDAFNGRAGTVASFGFGWVLSYDIAFLPFDGPQKRIVMPGSRFVNFVNDGTGTYKPFDDPTFDGATIRLIDATLNKWELKFKDGRIWRFLPFAAITGKIIGGAPTFVTEMVDSAGNALSITRQSNGRIVSIGSAERNVVMSYGTNGFVSDLKDTANRSMHFTYTPTNRIASVADADGKVTRFTYVDDTEIVPDPVCGPQATMGERIKTVLFPGKTTATDNFYGSSRRILRQLGQDGREYRAAYKVTGACVTHVSNPGARCQIGCPEIDSWENFQAGWRIHGGRIIGVTVIEPSGSTYGYGFNAKGTTSNSTDAQGQTTSSKYDSANRLIERTDVLGRTWKYQYDNRGNVTQKIDPLGRIVDYAYDDRWSKVINLTRYLPDNTRVVTQFTYDVRTGNVTNMVDPLGNATTFSYTPQGQLTAVTVPGNRTSNFTYNSVGDLVSAIDPLGNERRFEADSAGQQRQMTDPLGFSTQATYNGSSQVTRITDALNRVTEFSYDGAGRLAAVVNPLNNVIESYQYDTGDRLTLRTDAKVKSMLYEYDASGRLSQMTDRKSQVTRRVYDDQNRIVRIDYPDATQTRSYDVVGRLTEVREPSSVMIYAYDQVDRIVTAITDSSAGRQEVGYEYDTLDRITRRTVNGTDPTVYSYDNASRLISIMYRNQVTTYSWDGANRLTTKNLPNRIQQTFQYDDANNITQIQYLKPDNTLIDFVGYTYNTKGDRLSKTSGSSGIQETGWTAQYDVANRLTQLTLTGTADNYNFVYDDNGNLAQRVSTISRQSTEYVWDARNRLRQIVGPNLVASFEYDALDRRIAKTVNGNTIQYVYDGLQAIGEIVNGSVSETLLTGLNLDEVIARYTKTGNRTYLTDALNTVFAQANEDQSIQNYYANTPYGEGATFGSDDDNSVQYAGRENDKTGLYYYRARYYDPILKRFLSEDPIGLDGGFGVYLYTNQNPVNFSDPTGLLPPSTPHCFPNILRDHTGKTGRTLHDEDDVVLDAFLPIGGALEFWEIWQVRIHTLVYVDFDQWARKIDYVYQCYDDCGKLVSETFGFENKYWWQLSKTDSNVWIEFVRRYESGNKLPIPNPRNPRSPHF
jgi:RHS repeat-associated protein